jgi:FAD/FMN-containing dehydrogenase
MTYSGFLAADAAAAVSDLRAAVRGEVLAVSDPAYDGARRIWNGAADRRPAAIVRCADADDVAALVRVARGHDLPLSVLGGGHDWGGRSLCDAGLVADLSAMRRVSVDAGSGTANVEGGARATDVVAAAHPYGLAPVTGVAQDAGMAGLTLTGGYGPLIGGHGLALDNLLGAEVILADGSRITADRQVNPDLFWALRGGGGNFGVVTALRCRMHPIASLLSGLVLFPPSQARTVLHGYRELIAEAPDELTVMTGFSGGPDGRPLLFLLPVWMGDRARGETVVDRVRRLGTPVTGQLGAVAYQEMCRQFDPSRVNARHHEIRTRWLTDLTDDVVDVLVDSMNRVTSSFSALYIQHFHGAATRVPSATTAFALRLDHLLVDVVGSWNSSTGAGTAHGRWARALSDTLADHALPGGYPSLLGPDEPERVLPSYGPNASRLLEIKRRFDPDGVFTAVPALPAGGLDDLTK